MNQANMNMSVNEILAASVEAERKGVVVDWKQTCMVVCNAASQYIAAIEAQMPKDGEVPVPPEGE